MPLYTLAALARLRAFAAESIVVAYPAEIPAFFAFEYL